MKERWQVGRGREGGRREGEEGGRGVGVGGEWVGRGGGGMGEGGRRGHTAGRGVRRTASPPLPMRAHAIRAPA